MIKFNPLYIFIRSLQLEGTPLIEQEKGASLYTSARVSKLFGNVTTDVWPYAPEANWPLDEPPGLDEKAAPYRIHHYFRVRDENEIRCALTKGFPVSISIPIFSQWYKAENGIIQFPGHNDAITDMHAVTIVGYRNDDQFFCFRNSWGKQWGDEGYGWLPYGYFDRHGVEAVSFSGFNTHYFGSDPDARQQGLWEFKWELPTPIRTSMHGISLFDREKMREAAWAFAFVEKDVVDIEEFFVSPIYRKRGLARRLFSSLCQLSEAVEKPLRFWLPHIDGLLLGQDLHDLAWKFGLKVETSPVHWAAKSLVQRTSISEDTATPTSQVVSPKRCRASMPLWPIALGSNTNQLLADALTSDSAPKF